jgi:chitinase
MNIYFTLSLALVIISLTNACSNYHTVISGNTCYDIATLYGISLNDLTSFNPGLNCQMLQIGQKLCVSGSGGGSTGGSCSSYYVIKSGDYCYAIAQNNGISLDQFYTLNAGINCNNLQIGQIVCVSGNGGGSSGTTSAPITNPPSSGALVSSTQFINALVSNGYQRPRDDQYSNFISRAAPDGAITTKRELAMFLSQILWESGGLIYLAEIICLQNGCAGSYQTADDYAGQRYYGRGYIQLTWSYNYRAASQDLYNDLRLYTNPNQVALNDNIAWAVSFWYWKKNVHSRPGVSSGQFGVTTNAINGALECSGPYQDKARKRFDIYKKVLAAFGINEVAIESGCYN